MAGHTPSGVGGRRAARHAPPDEPLVVIEPGGRWGWPDLREVWACRELLYFLAWRDLKVRYKQTFLGVAWVIVQPLALALVFTALWGSVLNFSWGDVPYQVFAYAGLLPWTFFSGSAVMSGNSIVGNSQLITKVYFPRALLPAAAVCAKLIDFLVAFAALAAMLAFYGVRPTWGLLMLPPLVVLLVLFSLGFGLWASALNAKYRDVGIVLPVVLQLWMFVSPTVYPSTVVAERWQALYRLNPLAGIIQNFRAALLGQGFDWASLGFSASLTLALLAYSALFFRRAERRFAEVV